MCPPTLSHWGGDRSWGAHPSALLPSTQRERQIVGFRPRGLVGVGGRKHRMLSHAPPCFPVDLVAQSLSLRLFLRPFHSTGPGRYSGLHKSEKEALVTLLPQLVLHQLQLLPMAQPEKLRPRESGSVSESKTKLDRIQGPPCLC